MQENARAAVDVGSALLAQLVARGSDKAKVIGSSPVESIILILAPLHRLCEISFLFLSTDLAYYFCAQFVTVSESVRPIPHRKVGIRKSAEFVRGECALRPSGFSPLFGSRKFFGHICHKFRKFESNRPEKFESNGPFEPIDVAQ